MYIKLTFDKIHKVDQDYTAYLKRCAEIRLRALKPTYIQQTLNKYLEQQYNTSLNKCCSELIKSCKINFSKAERNYIITFPQQLDKFAELITYGNTEVAGSNLLSMLFKPLF